MSSMKKDMIINSKSTGWEIKFWRTNQQNYQILAWEDKKRRIRF